MQKLGAKTFQSRWQVSGGGGEKSYLQPLPGDRTERSLASPQQMNKWRKAYYT